MHHNYQSPHAPGPVSHNYGAHAPQLLKPTHLEPASHNKRNDCNEKPVHDNRQQPLLAAARESWCIATKTQGGQINNTKFKKQNKKITDQEERKRNIMRNV